VQATLSAMSRSSTAEKKQRAVASSELTIENTLRLVPSKNLPLALEFAVLSFATLDEVADVAMLSKSMGNLVKSFLRDAHESISFKDNEGWNFEPDADDCVPLGLSLMAHYSKLRVFHVPNVCGSGTAFDATCDLIVQVITKNSATLELVHFDSENEVFSVTMVAALANCRRLTNFEDYKVHRGTTDSYNSMVLFLTKRCRNLTRLSMTQAGAHLRSERDAQN
jgi:hypothetical protein